MIQRIQSVYLLLGSLVLGSLFFLETPWTSEAAATLAWFQPAVLGLLIASGVGGIGAIFLYTNRKLQRKVVVGIQVLTMLFAATTYAGLFMTGELDVRGPEGAVMWGKSVAIVIPIVAYVLYLLARRGIDHDIKLIEAERSGRIR